MILNRQPVLGNFTAPVESAPKPRLLFFRATQDNLPAFIRLHLQEHVKCLSFFFDVIVVNKDSDYRQLCEQYRPDLTLVESGGWYGVPRHITNMSAFPEIPKLGFLHADAYCASRSVFLSEMERWGIQTYFTHAVSMAEYMPAIADNLFVWPNFVDPSVFRDYGEAKIVPVLITGSHVTEYPWRNRVNSVIAEHFPTLTYPHFGWGDAQKTSRMINGEQYARMINASRMVPACGAIAKEVVRKHFEIPGCNSCLITEQTPALEAAGFVDMQNCVFATESDVLDKLNHLFDNRDVLETISRAGHNLVHSRHTLQHRGQMLEWLSLYKSLLPNQRIVQTGPFGPLSIVDEQSGLRNSHTLSNGVDRVLLRKGDRELRCGHYDEAERYYLSCVNYRPEMPEPILRLALCALYQGDVRKALGWITRPITLCLEKLKAADPDPVEWTYFIVSLLCRGDLDEATRRAHQFPLLRHSELDRCRSVIDALNHSTRLLSELSDQDSRARSRPSVHCLPERGMASWVNELCVMLKACKQGQLAEQLHKIVRAGPTSIALASSLRGRDRISGVVESKAVLPLTREAFRSKLRRRVPSKIRALLKSLIKGEECALAVRARARSTHATSGLILGAHDRSAYTRAFLAGVRDNPSMPTVFCAASEESHLNELKGRFARNHGITFSANAVRNAKVEAKVKAFDIVLVDREICKAEEAIDTLEGAKTVMVTNINTHFGHKIVAKLLSDRRYRMVSRNASHATPFAIFTRTRRFELRSNDQSGIDVAECWQQ